jgi:hypothetical protein
MDAGAWSCGRVANLFAGLVHLVSTVKQLIDRSMQEADAIIRYGLARLIATH